MGGNIQRHPKSSHLAIARPEQCQVITLFLWLYHRVGSVSYRKNDIMECMVCILGDHGHSRRHLTRNPSSLSIDSRHMRRLERWTVLMYTKNCDSQSVNETRMVMFTHGQKSLESFRLQNTLCSNMPCLQQHTSGNSHWPKPL